VPLAGGAGANRDDPRDGSPVYRELTRTNIEPATGRFRGGKMSMEGRVMRTLPAALLLILLVPVSSWATCTGAQLGLCLSLNQAAYQAGQNLGLTAAVTPGATPPTVDVYVALQLPTGTLLFLQGNGSFTTNLTPLVSGWTPSTFSGQLFSYTFGGGEPGGTYHWLAAFAQHGTLNFLGGIADTPFQFSPPTPNLSGTYGLSGSLVLSGCGEDDGTYPITGSLTLQQTGTHLLGNGEFSMPTVGESATLQYDGTVNGTSVSGYVTITDNYGESFSGISNGILGITNITTNLSGTLPGTACHFNFSWTWTRQ